MLARFRTRLTFANVVSLIALFVALGGSSYAALRVGSRQIVNNSVRSNDIRNNNVRSIDVRNGSLLARDFKAGQLPRGATGPPWAPGQAGAPGEDATSLFAYIRDDRGAGAADVEFGSGVTAVSDPADDSGGYTVTFNRNLTNCVVQAQQGIGQPAGNGASTVSPAHADVGVAFGVGDNEAHVTFYGPANTQVNTAFMVAAFC
jgi:hypothetical protein